MRGLARVSFYVVGLCLGLMLVACQPEQSPAIWSPVTTMGTSAHFEPPAVVADGAQTLFAWSGADAEAARLYAATFRKAATILALPTTQAFHHSAYPALQENAHILWMDTLLDEGPRLRAGTFSPDLVAVTGPITLSREDTFSYAATTLANSAIQVVWTEGFVSEPVLYTNTIDGQGRPAFSEKVAENVSHPALVTDAGGNVWLYWLWQGEMLQGRLVGAVIENPTVIAADVPLARGDYVDAFYTAMDETHVYVIWQISRGDGTWETWWASGDKASQIWSQPQRLAYTTDTESTFQTGFNSGVVAVASDSDPTRSLTFVSLARPLPGQHRSVPLATAGHGRIGIVYLQGGHVVGSQSLAAGNPLRAPSIAIDRALYLTLAWADERNDLKMLTTRPQ